MTPMRFCLRGWESWPTGREGAATAVIPQLLRRRVTPVGQQALLAAWLLPETKNARLILSSRHGEFSRTASLLESVTARGDVSPADFTLSVHHALIGLLSIVQKNCRGHTAVAAGKESFCFGLVEAIACLQENPDELVVLVHFDDVLSGPFATFKDVDDKPMALVLALSAAGEGENLHIDFGPATANAKPIASYAQSFLDFLTSNATEAVAADEQRQWRWSRHAVG